jgi:cell division protein FtsW (lipid II flippase)
MADCTITELGCLPNDPIQFIAKFYSIGLGIIGGLGVLFIIYGGYLIITSQGNPIKLREGQGYVKYAIIGILLAIFGYVLVRVITVDVLQIPGFG